MYKEHDLPTKQDEQEDMFGYVPAQTQCDFCGNIIPLKDAVRSIFEITPTYREHEHFCCDDHAIKSWKRRAGL